jgi:hypothetical protein
MMSRRTDYQQLPSDLPTMRVVQRTGFMSQFSKSCYNPDFLQSSDKNSSLNGTSPSLGFKRIITHYSEKQRQIININLLVLNTA